MDRIRPDCSGCRRKAGCTGRSADVFLHAFDNIADVA